MPASLYRPYFTPQELYLLDHTERNDVLSELNLLRVLLARVLEASQKAKDLTLKEHTAILSAFSRTGLTMARLARLHCQLHHPLEAVQKAIALGEHLARQKLGVYSYLSHLAGA